MNKQDLNFTAEIPHHEYDQIKIDIQEYTGEAVMTLEVDDGQKRRTTMTLSELKDAVRVFELYNRARAILSEVEGGEEA